MLPNDDKVMSFDDHAAQPPSVWTDRLPAKYREIGRHIEDLEGHRQAWVWTDVSI
jgi:hypothetical protein